jgi:non-ribosomal peptide synthase protein (TIGR01720 family)
LLFLFHHLIFDGVSWRIFMEDFQSIYLSLVSGEQPQLPPKTIAFRDWARIVNEAARMPVWQQETAHWAGVCAAEVPAIPIDIQEGENTYASTGLLSTQLEEDQTQDLLRLLPAVFGTQVNEVLLTALADTIQHWSQSGLVRLALEGHGREDLKEGVDHSRTIGWFTSTFPVLLDTSSCVSLEERLEAVKTQLRQVPNRGIGYGILRYLSCDPESQRALSATPEFDLEFNYLGQIPLSDSEEWVPIALAKESAGPEHSPTNLRPAKLIVTAITSGNELAVHWNFSRNLHRQETIERLAAHYLNCLRCLVGLARERRNQPALPR